MAVSVQSPEEASGQSSVFILGFSEEAKLTAEEQRTPAMLVGTIPEGQKTETVERASGAFPI